MPYDADMLRTIILEGLPGAMILLAFAILWSKN